MCVKQAGVGLSGAEAEGDGVETLLDPPAAPVGQSTALRPEGHVGQAWKETETINLAELSDVQLVFSRVFPQISLKKGDLNPPKIDAIMSHITIKT